jgi:ATP-dependent protease ClpP protease subunit
VSPQNDHIMFKHMGPRVGDEDNGVELVPFQGLVRYERQLPVRQVSYYICGELREPQYYTELFSTLRSAAETDLIYLHLNSPGGDFNTGLQIINNIAASDAKVMTVLEARAYSMAAMIFLSGDELYVHDNCQLMFHTYSGIFSGKGNEQQAEVAAVGRWFEKVMRRICTPFLSEEEVDNIIRGADFWMDSDEIRHRLAGRHLAKDAPRDAGKTPARKRGASAKAAAAGRSTGRAASKGRA